MAPAQSEVPGQVQVCVHGWSPDSRLGRNGLFRNRVTQLGEDASRHRRRITEGMRETRPEDRAPRVQVPECQPRELPERVNLIHRLHDSLVASEYLQLASHERIGSEESLVILPPGRSEAIVLVLEDETEVAIPDGKRP